MARLLLMLACLLAILLATSVTNAAIPELRAEVEIDRTQVYVNEQILVTVRVTAPATAFKVTKPYLKLENVELHSLHKRDFDQTIDGSDFTTSEIVYAVFVQQPGELVLPSQQFKATLPITEAGAGSNPIITTETNLQKVKIKPAIALNVPWLPAQSVSVNSNWAAESKADIRAGEPVKRTISIQIEGQHPSAIPDITVPEAEGVKNYPDLAQLELKKSITGLGGLQTRSMTLIMERAGTITLPELQVDWWDINDRSWKQATLPSETVSVQPASESPMWIRVRNRYRWAVLLLSVMTLSLATMCAVLWRKQRLIGIRETQHNERATAPRISEKMAWSQLKRSLKQQLPEQVRKNLLVWARARWPALKITRLDQLERIDNDLASSVLKLNNSLYAKQPKPDVDYGAITQLLQRLRKADTRIADKYAGKVRQKLYPDSR